MIDPSRIRIPGPLEPFAAGFVAELRRQGYTPASLRHQLELVAHLSRWLAAQALDSGALSPVTAKRFLTFRRDAGYTNHLSEQALRPVIAYLQGLGATPLAGAPVPDGPVEALLVRYRNYLASERGLMPATVRRHLGAVRPFLEHRLDPEGLELGCLSSADVTTFCVSRCPDQSQGTAKWTVTALRSLLGFLHAEGLIRHPLTGAVPSVASWQATGLPKGLEPKQVQTLLTSCDRGTANGRRDFAILTTLSRLGLRAGEIAALLLDDIDWRAGEILVCGKGRRAERLPLPTDVGEALTAYLQGDRPRTAQGRAVFVRVRAPHRALTSGGVSKVVAAAARRAGLPRIGAHRLRHTVATAVLRAGAPLAEVGQLLRHRRAATTAIYAKVDRERLRTIARPWPGGAR